MDNSEYADQELLKKTVAYRFVNSIEKSDAKYEDETLQLQADIVKHIVRHYNQLRKELRMDYSQDEMESGIIIM